MAGVIKPSPIVPAPALKSMGLLGSLGVLGSVDGAALKKVVVAYVTSKPVYDAMNGFLVSLKDNAPSYTSGLLSVLVEQALAAAEESLSKTAFTK